MTKHPWWLALIVYNLAFLGANLWVGSGVGWAVFSAFCALAVAWMWTVQNSRDRARAAREEKR